MSLAKTKVANQPFGPFPVVLVGADVAGRPNFATVGAWGVVSLEPVLQVSLRQTHHTAAGVRENGFFSVNLPSTGLVTRTDYCGTVSGSRVDKSSVFTTFYDAAGRAPMIRECPMNVLCRVVRTIPVYDFEMFLGEIVGTWVDDRCLKDGRPDVVALDPMVLFWPEYRSLGRAAGTVFREGEGYAPIPG